MPKDVKKLMRDYQGEEVQLSPNHIDRFSEKLDKEFSYKKQTHKFWYVAASVVLLLGFAIQFFIKQNIGGVEQPILEVQQVSLGDVSPEMKKIEDYYLTAIHYEIANLEVTQQNKALLDEYLQKLGELDADYKRLNQRLKKEGFEKSTVEALIVNLQIRLKLLIQLKDQIENKQPKENNYEAIL